MATKTKALSLDYKALAKDVLAKRTKDYLTMMQVQKNTKGKLKRTAIYKLELAENRPISTDTLIAACNWLGQPITKYIHH